MIHIRIVYINGTINTFAGNGTAGYAGDGGPATNSELNFPEGIAISSNGEVYIVDTGDNRIRIVYSNGTINTFAGDGNAGYAGDRGPSTTAELNLPEAITISPTGEIYIADTDNNRIRAVVNSPSSQCSNLGYFQSQSYCICPNSVMNSCISCFGINSGSTDVCSGHGMCIGPNNCQCYSGYIGYECQLSICYGVNQTASNICSGHGMCIGPNNCQCYSGYTGYECQLISCYGINETSPSVCSGHGICIGPNNCNCSSSFYGTECQIKREASFSLKLMINDFLLLLLSIVLIL